MSEKKLNTAKKFPRQLRVLKVNEGGKHLTCYGDHLII